MRKKYFVFVNDLIGVETNLTSFSWGFGKSKDEATEDEFAGCLVKVHLMICNDNELRKTAGAYSCRYRDYYADKGRHTILYAKAVKGLSFCYRLEKAGNELNVWCGKNYYRYVKYKIMYIFPVWYILFDFVTAILLENGLLPLYSSAVLFNGKATVMMAPPNTGKSLTALCLVNTKGAELLSEDLCITNGKQIMSVPLTSSYRGYKNGQQIPLTAQGKYDIDKLYFLERGNKSVFNDCDRVGLMKRIQIMNDYLLCYSKSIALDVYYHFNNELCPQDLSKMEKDLLEKLLDTLQIECICSEDPLEYSNLIMGEKQDG